MSFKIVEITEHSKTYLTAVPCAWERLGTLYWPNTTNIFVMQKLMQNSSSIPERYWLSQSCTLKKTNLRTFEAAEAEIERMHKKSNNKGFENHNMIFNQSKPKNNSEIISKRGDISSELENISKHIDQILNKQNKILMEIAKQNEFNGFVVDQFDQLNKRLKSSGKRSYQTKINQESSDEDDAVSTFGLLENPLSCQEDLNQLEICLNDSKKMEYMISKMKTICGESGSLDASYCCHKLVDHFFTRAFLQNVSWSGSRTERRKLGLKNYHNVICIFSKLVTLASKNFHENKCQEFFQRILRNSRKRYRNDIDDIIPDSEDQDTDIASKKSPDNTIAMRNLFIDPISNPEELDKLELDLKDSKKVEYLIDKMKRICGESGLLDATNCCYSLVDRFFTRAFLLNVTWSGGSRTGGSKLALKTYKNTLDVFNRLVTLASKDFDECKSKEFFQIVLKNSKQRYKSEVYLIPRKSAKKVRKSKEQVYTNREHEDDLVMDGVNDDTIIDIKCEVECAFEN